MSVPGQVAAGTADETAEDAASRLLVQRIVGGDTAAETELVQRYSRGIHYLLRHLTRDATLSEDLHQETFRVVLEKVRAGEIRQPERLTAFIRGIARNLWIGEWRKRGRRPDEEPVDSVQEPSDPSPGILSEAVKKEDRIRVRHLLKELGSHRDREILFRFYIAEEPKETLCVSLGLSSSQFNVVLFRARQRFRQLLEVRQEQLLEVQTS